MKYEEIMDRIEVTPEMRQRVLHNLENAQKAKKRRLTKQIFSLAACLAIIVCCWFAWRPKQAKEPEQGLMSTAQIETVDSLAALSEKTGMDLKELKGLPFQVEQTEYVSYWGSLAEIRYFGGTENLCYRKSQSTEDNSGDYNAYAQIETLEIAGVTVTLKGENGAFSLAVWTDGQYAYSISVSTPLAKEAFLALVEENIPQ